MLTERNPNYDQGLHIVTGNTIMWLPQACSSRHHHQQHQSVKVLVVVPSRLYLENETSNLEELVLHVDGDGAVSLGVGDAGEDESVGHLVVVEEGLLGLVDLSVDHLSGARRAGSGAAAVGEVDAGLLGGVDDEHVIGALDGGVDVVLLGDELDGVSEGGGAGHGAGRGGGEGLDRGGGEEDEEGLGEHGGVVDDNDEGLKEIMAAKWNNQNRP